MREWDMGRCKPGARLEKRREAGTVWEGDGGHLMMMMIVADGSF